MILKYTLWPPAAPLGSSDHNILHWLPFVDSIPSHDTQVKSVKSLVYAAVLDQESMLFSEDGLLHMIGFVTLNPILLSIAWQFRLQTS